jgi:glutathione S-transferase
MQSVGREETTMSLTLYFHPLSSFCQKALIALYENDTPFTPRVVNLMDETDRAAFLKIWPIGKFPVLRDEGRGHIVPEATLIIEYLAQQYPGRTKLIPTDADLALRTRLNDRIYDLYVNEQMQKIIGNRRRPADAKDPHGVHEARARLASAYDVLEKDIADKTWSVGDMFTMADCAACPALFYANMVQPFDKTHPKLAAYFERLKARPSYARAFKESEPFLHLVPQE